ncbi:pyruvate carboxylase [Desulfatibacillum alkenivorans DSM 16219]|jgi:pyruvate carboxylase|uniref:Pyruvate carboxylase n=1 Tax=Desulfatibacillum alkenivorans DSM 16219 TaxID=1121393 RepID=A0A1M6ZLI2_9BACT|nr:biotin/lipoyl-containing protein [Desulfatibacillum alkenivorans]SHL31195.1 pyruvate carboxylase [Desulfatibacillum alkenivorans DSM 16219]
MSIRITPGSDVKEALKAIRGSDSYFVTNTARDLSQSDFKNRILAHTDILVAPEREAAGYFSLEITGGASVHVDMLRKQINPFERLQLLRSLMPNTMFQTLCRGVNLFGYRPYPENVLRLTVKEFAKYVEVWRVFDFLNHVPNMIPVFEEVQRAGKFLEATVCFSTGPEHTDEFYVKKVGEILDVTGPDILLALKNHSGLGTPQRIGQLVSSLLDAYPDLIIHYHGHNTDGNDIGRIIAAVQAGAKIIDAADHAMTGFFGPPPLLTVLDLLDDMGYKAEGINRDAVIATSDKLKQERPAYAVFESQFKGFDPTVHTHKLPGGAMGSSFEQAVKGGFLGRMNEILMKELPRVHKELGNYWSVTPGSQILWTTAVTHTLSGKRYVNASEDLKRLLLERYGPFPFYRPADDIYEAAFGPDWKTIVERDSGIEECPPVDLEAEQAELEKALGRPADIEELVLYLQHPRDAVNFLKFEEEYGKTYVLPPSVWLRQGGFDAEEVVTFADHTGKHHSITFASTQELQDGSQLNYLYVDHHLEPFHHYPEASQGQAGPKKELTQAEIASLAEMGEVRAPMTGVVAQISLEVDQKISEGDTLLVLEAMKMLNSLDAAIAGVVSEVAVTEGQQVAKGDLLVRVRPLRSKDASE